MTTTEFAGRGRRVVIVEDNHAAADSMQQLLTYSGHDVRVAYNGPDGVQMAEDWPPDFVLCDIGLPGLDGYGVARALREHPATSRKSISWPSRPMAPTTRDVPWPGSRVRASLYEARRPRRDSWAAGRAVRQSQNIAAWQIRKTIVWRIAGLSPTRKFHVLRTFRLASDDEQPVVKKMVVWW